MKRWVLLCLCFAAPFSSPMACGGDGCLRNSDCPADQTCRAGRCELKEPPSSANGGEGGDDAMPGTAGSAVTAGHAGSGGSSGGNASAGTNNNAGAGVDAEAGQAGLGAAGGASGAGGEGGAGGKSAGGEGGAGLATSSLGGAF